MSQQTVVSIGGIEYDGHSGLPVNKQEVTLQTATSRSASVHAKGVHKTQQRSTALNRQFVKKSAPKPVVAPALRRSGGSMDMRRATPRSPQISKFARDPHGAVPKPVTQPRDIAHQPHPVAKKAQVAAQKSPVTHKAPSAKDIKHAALGKALAHAAPEVSAPTQGPKRRAFNIAAASLGVLLITGYFTYVNMPNLSVRVAAAQAGIDASYPEYRPVGYRLNGPVAYQDGKVSMNFASNSGPVAFALNQERSSWDSAALLEKYVDPRSEGKYATYSDAGLTIYTYGTDAAWVNGGIMYTVEGDASLSNEQIRRIATSL